MEMKMPNRPKHSRPALERLLREAEAQDWRVTKKGPHYQMKCPCMKHRRGVSSTPSSSRYELNLRQWLRRNTCWEAE